MKRFILIGLIIALIGAGIAPVFAAYEPVDASFWKGTVTCSHDSLEFTVYEGVPTYLLGFIPLNSGEELTLTYSRNGTWQSAGWTAYKDAGWLRVSPLFGVVGSLSPTQKVTVRVNSDGLSAGTYTDDLTFKFTTCATKEIVVPVTVTVIEPNVLGPLGIGVDKDLLKNICDKDALNGVGEENEYGGLVVNLLTNPDDAMDMQAIETDGSWSLNFILGEKMEDGSIPFTHGNLNINKESSEIVFGVIAGLDLLMGMMPPGALPIDPSTDFGNNYAAIMITDDGVMYIGILLADLPKLLEMDLESMLGGLLGAEKEEASAQGSLTAPTGEKTRPGASSANGESAPQAPETDILIPLAPILNVMPTLMPVLFNLLDNETVMAILNPLLGALPPIMIVLPMKVLDELMEGLM